MSAPESQKRERGSGEVRLIAARMKEGKLAQADKPDARFANFPEVARDGAARPRGAGVVHEVLSARQLRFGRARLLHGAEPQPAAGADRALRVLASVHERHNHAVRAGVQALTDPGQVAACSARHVPPSNQVLRTRQQWYRRAMTSRQIGHLFFEPKTYDVVNQATHEHKEEIKVGYNLNRKIVLLTIWKSVSVPVLLVIWISNSWLLLMVELRIVAVAPLSMKMPPPFRTANG